MRYWTNEGADSGAIHALGNGSFLLYGQGPGFFALFGTDYSGPSVASVSVAIDGGASCETERAPGTNNWNHLLRCGGNEATFWDALDPEYNVFHRVIRSGFPFRMPIAANRDASWHHWDRYDCGGQELSVDALVLPRGTEYFSRDRSKREARLYVLTGGCVSFDRDAHEIVVSVGEGRLIFVLANPDDADRQLAFASGKGDVAGRSDAYWRAFVKRGEAGRAKVDPSHPEVRRVLAAMESVSILIKAQQSRDGGVMAGHYYPMAYVRDQAGTLRGLLSMGYFAEAKAILAFWKRKWDRFGNLYNAESMGHDEARLMFSNDEVEVPAYVMLSAFRYADVTGDRAYLDELYPLLEWAMGAQRKHLALGMTSFSGDETYIAGFILPRAFINHGSAESTMLFIESGKRFIALAEGRMDESALAACREDVSEAERRYRANFVPDGRLVANRPERMARVKNPRFHFGFCDACNAEGHNSALTYMEREPRSGLYLCPNCFGRADLPDVQHVPWVLASVSLNHAYYESSLFDPSELEKFVSPSLDEFERTGEVSSVPGGDRSLGYDYGLMLVNLLLFHRKDADRALTLMLDRLDGTLAWSEYYQNGVAYNCRCRPWESAINIEAAMRAVAAK